MNKIRFLLGKIPLFPLLILTVFLGLAPFVPEPHAWEKLKMLMAGTLNKPVDILDFLMHLSPAVLLLVKILFQKSDASGNHENP